MQKLLENFRGGCEYVKLNHFLLSSLTHCPERRVTNLMMEREASQANIPTSAGRCMKSFGASFYHPHDAEQFVSVEEHKRKSSEVMLPLCMQIINRKKHF